MNDIICRIYLVIYKYTGLLKCGECGKNLITTTMKRKEGDIKAYICLTYHRYGKKYCSLHRVNHDDLDSIVFKELEALYESGFLKMDIIDKSLEQRDRSNRDAHKQIDRLQIAINAKKLEIKHYSKQLAQGLINEELFREMTQESSAELEKLEQQLSGVKNIKEVRENEKAKLASALNDLRDVIDRKELTHADLTILIDKIMVSERKGKGLDIEIMWTTPFSVIKDALAEAI